MFNTEIIEKNNKIKFEIYRFFKTEIMRETMDEYLTLGELIVLVDKLEEMFGFAIEIEEVMGNIVQDDNFRRYIWIGTQRMEMSRFKNLRVMADSIIAALVEEVEIVKREFSYYRELMLDYLEWSCRHEKLNIFIDMLSAISVNRFCDEAFAEILSNAGFIVSKEDYCGCKNTYYVETQNGKRIWFDNVLVKNGNNPVRHHRPRIEVLHSLQEKKFRKRYK